jgi:hypothetical protein
MANIHHKPIKRFSLSGNIHDEAALWRLRIEYQKLLESEMRLSGYVPRLDINQDFTVDYNQEKQYFEFELSIYAIYVGKKKSEWIAGVDETKVIYTHPNKSNVLSQEAA